MANKQIAAVLYAGKDLRIEERTVPKPGVGEAVIHVMATGLCGSDLHYYRHGRNGNFVMQSPMVLGHEAGGIVISIGEGVTNVKPGDRVAIEAGISCKSCKYCRMGRYNLCQSMRFCAAAKTFPHLDGTLSTMMKHPADSLHILPDSLTFEYAALAEPLSVVIHASRRAKIQPGEDVLVLGAGAVGLLACMVARASGATRCVVVDINTSRLEFAKREGFATDTYLLPTVNSSPTTDEPTEFANKILVDLKQSHGFAAVYECTGVQSCAQLAIKMAETGGRVIIIGMGTPIMTLPIAAAAFREVDIIGSFRYANTYPAALQMMDSNVLYGIEKLVTHRFPLSKSVEAFETLSKGKSDDGNMALKIMIGEYP